jgi:hypothetical protein
MKLTSLQLITRIHLRGSDFTSALKAGPELELIPLLDDESSRRDVLIRRPGEEDVLVWQENIACATIGADEQTHSRGDGEGGSGFDSPPSSVATGAGPGGEQSPPKGRSRARKAKGQP